ncbi:unnamed protein product [Periconia digitata]|uniref:AAA+ ATPase domain-containing protein n=1 Tax=Periconia digitata TaxID=1303443 RepID=A0A9W4U7K7_9PLEO|nr:unnamed protein product [Periconia digitata]
MKNGTPSSLSRDRYEVSGLLGLRSILGKRRLEHSPPADTKRHSSKHIPNIEQTPSEDGDSGSKQYESDSDDDGRQNVEDERLPGPARGPAESRTSGFNTTYDRHMTSQKNIFQTRLVHRRQSISSFEWTRNITESALDTVPAQEDKIAASRRQSEFAIVYRIKCDASKNTSIYHDEFFYEDDPLNIDLTGRQRTSHISGTIPVYQLHEYARSFSHSSFLIIKDRHCGARSGGKSTQREREETILILNEDLRQAIQRVTTCSLEDFTNNKSLEFRAPYQYLYHHEKLLRTHSQSCGPVLKEEIEAVIRYVVARYGEEYTETEKLMSRGKITNQHLDKIFWPNQLIGHSFIGKGERLHNPYIVGVAAGWPHIQDSVVNLEVWSWKISGRKCVRDSTIFRIRVPVEDDTEEFPLIHLKLFPLSILNESLIHSLRQRGKKAWGLRHYHYIHHTGDERVKPGRYMIDKFMYDKLNGFEFSDPFGLRNTQTDPWRLALDSEAEPTEDEFLLMPTYLPGYDLLEKDWVDLSVDKIEPIQWENLPFDEDLVLPAETKRLIKAMVTVRASSIKKKKEERKDKEFDIISGKGKGLIMLFHGSPGTGKTLTAESVAEIAQMPLYPITCGDMGTDPDKVESYLRLAFKLGQRWNCVLLLDEADVFLEARGQADLQRNSLVSVFLRMIEYYEGILILTSNRVGTFDEAFRSRINIALHYEDLKPRSRKQIWSNFLTRLEGTEHGENVEEIKHRLDELANHKLNGREIRNALSTARQLASYENKKLDWEHLELAIKTANTFGRYLKDFHDMNNSSWVEEKRIR